MRRVLSGSVLAGTLLLNAACTVQSTEFPAPTGPSEYALSLELTAAPDTLTQDGFSRSTVVVTTRGPQGAPVAGVVVRLSTSLSFGTLSTGSVTTGSDGRATAAYTAPLASPFQAGAPPTRLWIYATPVGTNAETAQTQHVEVLLLTPPVPTAQPGAPVAAVAYTPANPKVGETVLFDASASAPGPGHQIVTYYWNFGDGLPNDEHGVDASHTYLAPGTYTMILGVVDEIGQVASTFKTITVTP
jgi:PKD repeat protein